MKDEELATLADSVVQLYSLSAVCKNYTDTTYIESNIPDERMLHVGLMMDKINEQVCRMRDLMIAYKVIP